MRYAQRVFWTTLPFVLAACVTVNIYFPAAAAEKAAETIVKDVYGKQKEETPPPPESPATDGNTSYDTDAAARMLAALGEFVIPPAHAQQPNIDISSPAIRSIKASMKKRHASLAPYYNSGAVGLTRDGFVKLRAPGAVPLRKRNKVNQLVAAENRDRNALYEEIARANGHPEWEQKIQQTFAKVWIKEARRGWWYQDRSGSWKQK